MQDTRVLQPKIIGILGLPYCGSTLLSYILGSHSQIYNAADLYKLNPRHKGKCSIHGEKCPVWTTYPGCLTQVPQTPLL
ncbi:MAG: hypothetical protein QNJ53_17805 [Pleurocapsa sp. MO_192.B19]|nr:hypothetical protein [Pleurocapsa sp. MO_192.B19]